MDANTSVVVEPQIAVQTDPAVQADAGRKADLNQARKNYLRCIGGARSGGGSDLVGRAFRALGLSGFAARQQGKYQVAAGFVTVDAVIAACRSVDNAKALEWANAYISGLEANKANERRAKSFAQFLADGGFKRVADALEIMVNASAFTYTEAVTVNGSTVTAVQDIRRDINDIFGLKLTFARRARYGTIA